MGGYGGSMSGYGGMMRPDDGDESRHGRDGRDDGRWAWRRRPSRQGTDKRSVEPRGEAQGGDQIGEEAKGHSLFDPYFNIVEVKVYGQARFYNPPPEEPEAEPSLGETAGDAAEAGARRRTTAARPKLPRESRPRSRPPKADAAEGEPAKSEAAAAERRKAGAAEGRSAEGRKAGTPRPARRPAGEATKKAEAPKS